jgi:integrase
MKATLKFLLVEAKKSPKNGRIPLYVRIIADCRKAEKCIGEVDPADAGKWEEATMRFTDPRIPVNRLIAQYQTRFDNLIYGSNFDQPLTALEIRDLITGTGKKERVTVAEYAERYYQKTVVPNKMLAAATKKGYQKAKNHLQRFLIHRDTERLAMDSLTTALALEFKDYLLSDGPGDKKAMQEQSAAGTVKKLRTIFDRAVDEGILDKDPFHKVKLRNYSPQRPRLNIHQVKAILQLDLSENETTRKYRDMFLFSVFTGLAHCDVISLSKSDLTATPHGYKLYLKRAKTETETHQFLPEMASRILKQYAATNEALALGRCFPCRSNKETNVQLKFIGTMAGVPFPLSFHLARHTFRQLIAEADIVETGVIKKMMGHSTRREIDGVYYQVTESRLLEAKSKLDAYLKSQLNDAFAE